MLMFSLLKRPFIRCMYFEMKTFKPVLVCETRQQDSKDDGEQTTLTCATEDGHSRKTEKAAIGQICPLHGPTNLASSNYRDRNAKNVSHSPLIWLYPS
jgi:hypothetical protein